MSNSLATNLATGKDSPELYALRRCVGWAATGSDNPSDEEIATATATIERLAELEAKHQTMFEALTEVGVRRIEVIDGKVQMELTLAREMMCVFAGSALAMLDESNAENCLEMQLVHPELRQRVTLTLQRHPGKTPMQLKAEAERRLDELRAAIKRGTGYTVIPTESKLRPAAASYVTADELADLLCAQRRQIPT